MYISWDGGKNWQRKTRADGLPEGELGRITFAPSAAQRGRIYALVEAEKSAMLRSDDGGESWTRTNQDYDIAVRPFYYTEVAADPEDANRVYNIFTRLSVSIDAGKTFELNPVIDCCAPSNTVHIDNHALWINPGDSRHLIVGNDGGIAISRDRGATWRFVRNLPLSQFYHIAVDNEHPYNIYGGLQDNGSWRGPSEVWENAGIRNLHWQEVGFGDGFDTLPDPENARRGYVMSQGGMLFTWNLDNGEQRMIRPAPHAPDTELRFNWNAAIAQDPFDAGTIYYGSQFVHRSDDRGRSWQVISGDLTSNDPERQIYKQSGGLTPDVTTAENYTTLVSIAPSPLEKGTLWTGSDDGRVHITRDGGGQWERVDGRARGVPAGSWVPMIAASPHDAGTAFVVFDNHRRSDMQPYVFRVTNYGRNWENLATEDLSGYALSVLQDHEDPDLLFLGTEFGLYVSTNAGSDWTRFTEGVPTVSVMYMAIQQRENDLVLGTHGRSVYVLDDYSALRGLGENDFEQRLKILSTTPGQQYTAAQTPSTRFTGSGEFRADNEPYGVVLTFIASGRDLAHPDPERERERQAGLDDKSAEQPVRVEMVVKDQNGNLVRKQKFPVHQGINRLVWGMRHDGVRPMPGPEPAKLDDGLPPGPEVPPGDYQVTLSLAGEKDAVHEASAAVRVVPDPRSEFSAQARQRNYETLLELQKLNARAVTAVEQIVKARADIDTVLRLVKDHRAAQDTDPALDKLEDRAGGLNERLDDLESRFRTPPETRGYVYDDDKVVNRIGLAAYYVGSTADEPTETAERYIDDARKALQAAEQELGSFLSTDLADVSLAVRSAGIGLFSSAEAGSGG